MTADRAEVKALRTVAAGCTDATVTFTPATVERRIPLFPTWTPPPQRPGRDGDVPIPAVRRWM